MAETTWQTNWSDNKFIEDWASKSSWHAPTRDVQTAMVLRMIPQPIDAPIRVLDIGAGFGAPGGGGVARSSQRHGSMSGCFCSDVEARSRENPDLKDRMTFVQGSLEVAGLAQVGGWNFRRGDFGAGAASVH